VDDGRLFLGVEEVEEVWHLKGLRSANDGILLGTNDVI
jgi:hypothetical protein